MGDLSLSEKRSNGFIITSEDIIEEISQIRANNNKAWMDLLKLAFKENPEEAKKIFSQITENDKKINNLSKELCDGI